MNEPLMLTDEPKPYYTEGDDLPVDVDKLQAEIDIYHQIWLDACQENLELLHQRNDAKRWAAAWKAAARTWRRIANGWLSNNTDLENKIVLLSAEIEQHTTTIRKLHERIEELENDNGHTPY